MKTINKIWERLWHSPKSLTASTIGLIRCQATSSWYRFWWLALALCLLGCALSNYRCYFTDYSELDVHTLILCTGIVLALISVRLLRFRAGKIIVALLGMVLLSASIALCLHRSAYINLYNQGIRDAYTKNDCIDGLKSFEAAIKSMDDEPVNTRLIKPFLPAARLVLKPRSIFHMANCLAKLQQLPDAVKTYQDALTWNPGNFYSRMTLKETAEWYSDYLFAANNLSHLYKSGQKGGHANGKGKNSKDGKGSKDGEKDKGKGQPKGPQVDNQPDNNSNPGKFPNHNM
jgi:hypothetical protein